MKKIKAIPCKIIIFLPHTSLLYTNVWKKRVRHAYLCDLFYDKLLTYYISYIIMAKYMDFFMLIKNSSKKDIHFLSPCDNDPRAKP